MTKTSLLAAALLAAMHLAGCAVAMSPDGSEALGERSEPLVAPVDECSSLWSCTGNGELVLHREGSSCMLGDVVLSVDGMARYRESSYADTTPDSWKLAARTIHFDNGIRCDRND